MSSWSSRFRAVHFSLLAGFLLTAHQAAGAGQMKWTHFTIADPLPGSSWGTGGLPLLDLDGDIDIVTKIWNKDGVAYHADYWRNDTLRRQTGEAVLRFDFGPGTTG